jgi:type I restriction enzyme S subunit
MVNNWGTKRIDEIAQVVDSRHKTPQYSDDGYPMVRVVDVKGGVLQLKETKKVNEEVYTDFSKGRDPEIGDLIISRVGSYGNVAYVNSIEKFCLGQNTALIIPEDKSRYLYYALTSPQIKAQIEEMVVGAVQKTISLKTIKNIKIPEPPAEVKKKISKVLSTIDDKIELNRQTNQTLEEMAQTLFKSWFVDFDPVFDNALAAGTNVSDFPEALQQRALLRQERRKQAQQLAASPKTKSKPLPEDILSLFPSEFEQTDELSIGINGWIPKSWKESNTDEEFGIKGGSTPSTKNSIFWEGGQIHWTSPKDLSGNNTKIILDTSRKVTEAGLAKITSGLLPVDTVLMSSRAPVGYLALAKVPLAINQGYIALLCEKTLTPEYTIQFLDSIMDEIKGISGGTTFAEISKKTFRSIKLVVPTKSVVDAYTSVVRTHYEKITENIKQTNTLTETRDYLLPKLISGELTIPDTIKTENNVNHQQPKESLSNHA